AVPQPTANMPAAQRAMMTTIRACLAVESARRARPYVVESIGSGFWLKTRLRMEFSRVRFQGAFAGLSGTLRTTADFSDNVTNVATGETAAINLGDLGTSVGCFCRAHRRVREDRRRAHRS